VELRPRDVFSCGSRSKELALVSSFRIRPLDDNVSLGHEEFPRDVDIRKGSAHESSVDPHSLAPLGETGERDVYGTVARDELVDDIGIVIILALREIVWVESRA
jgi:hypothetical protein